MTPSAQGNIWSTFLFWAMDVIREQFDKLLLAWLLMFFTLLAFIGSADPESQHWLRELTSGVLGALLGLITGVKIGQGMVRVNAPTDIPKGSSPKETTSMEITKDEVKPLLEENGGKP